uniref:Glutathione transferase n=1 Tax=Rhabditophanes sp. KR3021 TaxID=114890 RepID=A0AC35U815_9BILA
MPVIPQFTLHYFDLMGKAETIRLIFTYAGVKFTDNRIQKEDWPKIKETMAFGQIPMLEMDGKKLYQSRAIERFLARMYGLLGDDDLEAAYIDQFIGGLDDVIATFRPAFGETDEEKKKIALGKVVQEHIIPCLKKYNDFIAENGTGHLVGKNGKVNLADLALFHILWFLTNKINPQLIDGQPELKKFFTAMSEDPKLKGYLATRKITEF